MNPRERDNVNLTLIALTCALLMVLPLVTTFDDLLTAGVDARRFHLGARQNLGLQLLTGIEDFT